MDYESKVLSYFDKEEAVLELLKKNKDGMSIKMICDEIGKSQHWVRKAVKILLEKEKITRKRIGGVNVHYA